MIDLTDSGTTWTGISDWYGGFSKPYVHADQHGMAFRPGNSNEALFSNDEGYIFLPMLGIQVYPPHLVQKIWGTM